MTEAELATIAAAWGWRMTDRNKARYAELPFSRWVLRAAYDAVRKDPGIKTPNLGILISRAQTEVRRSNESKKPARRVEGMSHVGASVIDLASRKRLARNLASNTA